MLRHKPKITYFLIGFFILALSVIACTGSYKAISDKWDIAAIYNPAKSRIHPSFKVYHNSTISSTLFVKLFTNELLFQPLGPNGEMVSDVSMKYTLLEISDNNNFIADSGTFNTTFYKKNTGKSTLSQIPIKAEKGKSYHLKVITRDKLRRSFYVTFIDVEKTGKIGEQFFNITHLDGSPIFKNALIGNGTIRVMHANPSSDKLYISYFKNETPLPKPTFAVSSDNILYERPDSIYSIDYKQGMAIQLLYEGLYFIQFDTTLDEGVSITKFEDNFPQVKTKYDLVEPLAYITTSAEYKKLLTSENKKLAADNFWIRAAGSTDKGRELIRIFYNRVYFANYYFTTAQPGWKTDRGMVYIVYGPPHNLKKTYEDETWYYHNPGSPEPISFTFVYSPSKFYIDQYKLKRSEGHTWHWREAVYAWNNGKIFLQE